MPCAQSLQPCTTFCGPVDCGPLGSSVRGFLRGEYWSGLPCPPPGDLPNPGIEHASLASSVLQEDSLLTEPPGKHPDKPYMVPISKKPQCIEFSLSSLHSKLPEVSCMFLGCPSRLSRILAPCCLRNLVHLQCTQLPPEIDEH